MFHVLRLNPATIRFILHLQKTNRWVVPIHIEDIVDHRNDDRCLSDPVAPMKLDGDGKVCQKTNNPSWMGYTLPHS